MTVTHVGFAGGGAGVGELSWGQLAVWQAVADSGNSLTLSGVTELPDGVTVGEVAGLVGWVVGRHPALRTRYETRAPGPPRQRCHAAGELALEVVEAGGQDPDAVAAGIRDRYQAVPFDLVGEWPLRVAVVCAGGRPVRQVVAYAHLAVDAGGLAALVADLAAYPVGIPVPGLPPLEQARRQREPAALRQQAAALRYAERIFRSAPSDPLGPPVPGRPADHAEVSYRSRAALLAARRAGARTGAGSAAVLLAAYGTAVARTTGRAPVLVSVVVSNRFRPGLAGSVSTVSQLTPLLVDPAAGPSGAAAALLAAAKYGGCDPYARDELADRVGRERGAPVLRRCFLNDRRGPDPVEPVTAEQVRSALPSSTASWPEDPQRPRMGLYLHLSDLPGAVELRLSGDLRHFTRDQLLALLRDVERIAVETALS